MEKHQELPAGIEVGREVRSPQYGKGVVAEINDDTVRVRFWNAGHKTFHKPEGNYPFELLDEVRVRPGSGP
jgi:hypothetical protein